jgi:hypothetical protein
VGVAGPLEGEMDENEHIVTIPIETVARFEGVVVVEEQSTRALQHGCPVPPARRRDRASRSARQSMSCMDDLGLFPSALGIPINNIY